MKRPEARALLGLLLLALLLFRRAVFGGEALYERDLGFWYYAQVESIVRVAASGSWPLWDPYMAFGSPLLANPSAQILYPFTLLHALFVPWTFYTLYVVSHLVLAGFGQYLLARRFALSPEASLLAAGGWAASGPLLSFVNMWHHFSGAAWIPWVMLGADRAAASRRTRDALAWAAALAAQILAGSADMCAISGLASLAVAIRHLPSRRPFDAGNLAWLRTLALGCALAAAATAAQWLPSLELVRTAQRAALPEVVRTQWSVHPLALVQAAVPVVTEGLPLRDVDPRLAQEVQSPLLESLYLGAAILAFAAAGLGAAGRPGRVLFAGLLLVAVLVALGRYAPVYGALVRLVPPLALVRFPMKAMILAPLACGILAGTGFDRLREGRGRRGALAALALVAAGCGAVSGFASALPLRNEPWLPELLAQSARRCGWSASVALVCAALLWRSPRRLSLVAAAGTLAVLELAVTHASLNPTAPAALLAARPATVAAIQGEGAGAPVRIYTFDYFWPVFGKRYPAPEVRAALGTTDAAAGPPALGRALGLRMLYPASGRWELASSFDRDNLGLHPAHLRALVTTFRASEETPAFARMLAMGSVRYVLALHGEGLEDLAEAASVTSPFPLPIRVFRVPDPLPSAYVVGRGRVAPGEAAFQAMLSGEFDPRREVLLDQGPAAASDGAAGSARVVERKPDRVLVEVELDAPGYLVLTDNYDPGWQATLDGARAPVLRANGAFRAVAVPAGRHRVEQRYRPRSVALGLGVSLLGLLAGAALFARSV